MTNAQTNVQGKDKFFYYYPGHNETREYRRRVLAGYFDGKQIHVAQAVVFPGRKATLTVTKNGFIYDVGMKPDSFNKKEGRLIASIRARGGFWNHDTILNSTVFQERKQTLILTIPVPDGTVAVGKLFVTEVERYLEVKGFPLKPLRKAKEKTPNTEPSESGQKG